MKTPGVADFWPIYDELQRLNVPLCVHNRREGPAEKNVSTALYSCTHTVVRWRTFIQFAGLMYGGSQSDFRTCE